MGWRWRGRWVYAWCVWGLAGPSTTTCGGRQTSHNLTGQVRWAVGRGGGSQCWGLEGRGLGETTWQRRKDKRSRLVPTQSPGF